MRPFIFALIFAVCLPACSAQTWTFAVSGDSRNCGDVVMPAIAKKVLDDHAAFYWHLGDFRAMNGMDQDWLQTAGPDPGILKYEAEAWLDFIQNQLGPFGGLPVYLGKGNHETGGHKTPADYLHQFDNRLNAPVLREQRLRDNSAAIEPKAYFHWIQGGVDFITLDNSTSNQIDAAQMAWLSEVLKKAAANKEIKSLVLGMHAALPDSLSAGHSMNDSSQGTKSGREIYQALVDFQEHAKKHVYVLASHSHFVLSNIYDTACRRLKKQTVLPGWIVGTGGAVRYRLPKDTGNGKAQTDVYGYLLGTVSADGTISFDFREVTIGDVPQSVSDRYTSPFVNQCFSNNRSNNVIAGPVQPPKCQ